MTLWNEVLEQLKINISKASYDTWFSSTTLRPFEKDDDTLVIEVPNDFARDWLEGKYTTLTANIITNITGKQYALEFVANPQEDINDQPKQIPITENELKSTSINKLDQILFEIKEMNQRLSSLEHELQETLIEKEGK